jgi:MFS family permease
VNSARSWIVFSVAGFAYLCSVMQRSTLGVAGLDAVERFHVQAAVLSTMAVVQIVAYAALQVPIGVLIDRIGPKRLIIVGGVLMTVGQFAVAFAPDIGLAIVGRILVGGGDAFTFISAQRSVASWFSGRRAPMMSQLLGTAGQLGQVLSAVPFALALHAWGWQPAFTAASSLTLLATLLVVSLFSDSPEPRPVTEPLLVATPLRRLRDALARPGTQLGFWAHFVTQSSVTTFVLLWGVPFLSVGLGYGSATAALMLSIVPVTSIVLGPVLGILTARYPMRRSNVVIGIVVAMAIAWGVLLAWPGVPPLWLVIAVIVVISVGGPGSLIGFDYARSFNPARSLGSANGIVNVGGFLASFVMMYLIGLVLDLLDSARGGTGEAVSVYSLDSFRIAFLVQFVIVGIGVAFLVSARRRTRRLLHDEEGITVAPLWVALSRRWRKA